jgi:hypothetical protein
MVCSNCKSKEIIAIQGQNYCLSCGQMVANEAPAVAVPSPLAADLAAKIADTPLKIVTPTPAPPAPAPRPAASELPAKKHVTDIAPPKKPAPKLDAAAIVTPETYHVHHDFHTSIILVAALATMFGFAGWIALGNEPIVRIIDLMSTSYPLQLMSWQFWSVTLLVVSVAWLIYSPLVLAQAAITVSRAKRLAGRDIPDATAWKRAREAFWGIVSIDARAMLWLVALGIVHLGIVQILLNPLVDTSSVQAYLLAVITFVIGYVAIGIVAARNLALVNFVLTDNDPRAALAQGWQFYYKHQSDILAGTLLVIAVVMVAMIPAFALLVWLRMTPASSGNREYLTAAWLIATALGVYGLLNYCIHVWERLYHTIVHELPAGAAASLRRGRTAAKGHNLQRWSLGAVELAALAAVGGLSWQTGWLSAASNGLTLWLGR